MMGVDFVLKIKINIYIRHDGCGLCTQKLIFISAMMGVDRGLWIMYSKLLFISATMDVGYVLKIL